MKLHVIFVGNKFIYNKPLKEYILRQVEEKFDFIDIVTHFKESDNSLFLYLEQSLSQSVNILLISSKQNFSTIGKLICTATGDNQVLKDGMLIPQKSELYGDGTYLIKHNDLYVNILRVDEMQNMPDILIQNDINVKFHLFDEDKDSAVLLLQPIAQTFDVSIDIVKIIDGWLSIAIVSNKYGDIPKFLKSVKKLY